MKFYLDTSEARSKMLTYFVICCIVLKDMKNEDLDKINSLLLSAEKQISNAREILFGKKIAEKAHTLSKSFDESSIEGVFDGLKMIDSDGKSYPVAANYASKSKLIPGDVLKLSITKDGTFLFKQIGPVPRKKVVATLEIEEDQYYASCNDKKYKVLTASITYFKAELGDKITIIVPEDSDSEYAAVENIVS